VLVLRNHWLVNFVIARLGSDGVQREHKDVYWFRWNVPTSSDELFVLLALEFEVGATNGRERDELPSLCGLRVSVCCFVVRS
jgi:hypothetical protein